MTTTVTAVIDGAINTQYGVESGQSGQRYPAIQASSYEPKANEDIVLILSEGSVEAMNPDYAAKVVSDSISVDYCDRLMFTINPLARFVVLAMPRMFSMDKATKEIFPLAKGQKLKPLNRVTAARLLLAMIIGDELVVDTDGNPQIFTLKLTSTKTNLIGGDRDAVGASTIHSLNKSLGEHFKAKSQWLTHLVSINIKAIPDKFINLETGKSKVRTLFSLAGGAKALSSDNQRVLFNLITSDDFKALAADPFHLSGKVAAADGFEPVTFDDSDEIPF